MFRILLLFILIFYVLYKLGLFRVFAGGVKQGYFDSGNPNQRAGGSVNIDSAPPKEKREGFKGGEYVDYEEVK
ncbi:MAG: hypothetical protein KF725_02820 [Cyclobacteriaceae bacterium]|nr:hypothetical protein [Cyclobacteriaceae bacterium]UYN86631.1 MAG: hypothetical protein KIT51_17515 [Cyclobacteriaceae bacterium]